MPKKSHSLQLSHLPTLSRVKKGACQQDLSKAFTLIQ